MSKIGLLNACNITTGKLDSNAFEANGMYPFFTCAPEPLTINTYAFEENAILLAGNNAAGNFHCQRYAGKFNAYQRTYVITAKKGYDIDYIYYNLKLNLKNLAKISQGSQTKFLTMKILESFMLEDISYNEQKNKVDILSEIDNKIENNNAINTELESIAKTIYDYWFLQFEFPNEEGKPYKSSGGKMVWNEELKREIPEGWNTTNIGNITKCLDSNRIPLSNAERELRRGNIPYYGATGIMDYVDEAIFDGDYVLMAEDGSVMDAKGNPILQRLTGKAWVNNHAHVLQPSKNHGCKLLMMLLKDVSVMKIKTGSIQMKINQENMNKIIIPEIPEHLIDKTNLILDDIDFQILHREKENRELASLRDFLLPLLMNGQVGFKG